MDSTISPQTRLTVSVGSRIPPELVDTIIDASKDDKSFLKICGLVCRTWVPASRRRLFEHVTLNDHNLAEFARLVESHLVTIPRYVRQLDIRQLSYQNVLDNTRVLSRVSLHLQCREDDGGPDCRAVVTLTDLEEFECPKHRSLVIDSRNYYEAYRRNVRWTDKIPLIASLTVSHFNPRPNESFTTSDFLRPLAAFRGPESTLRVSSFVHHLDTGNLVGRGITPPSLPSRVFMISRCHRYRQFLRTLVDSLHA